MKDKYRVTIQVLELEEHENYYDLTQAQILAKIHHKCLVYSPLEEVRLSDHPYEGTPEFKRAKDLIKGDELYNQKGLHVVFSSKKEEKVIND